MVKQWNKLIASLPTNDVLREAKRNQSTEIFLMSRI